MRIKKIIYNALPDKIKKFVMYILECNGQKKYADQIKKNAKDLRKTILQYYADKEIKDDKLKKAVEYLRANQTDFYMKRIKTDPKLEIKYGYDKERKLPYVIHSNGKKLYFKRDMNKKKVIASYRALLNEQNIASPHLYLQDKKKSYHCVVDAGASEGIFSLDIIDYCEKLYLIECDSSWKEALEATFRPYWSKVVICNNYLGDQSEENSVVSLDDLLKEEEKVDLIKMDIEGAEPEALKGGTRTLARNQQCQLLVCVYHYQKEEDEVDSILKNYEKIYRDSYVIFPHDPNQHIPYFRNGVVTYKFGKKN